jgi:hypothetical protein
MALPVGTCGRHVLGQVGTLLYIGVDAWLTGNERLRQLRHSIHAAMVGQPMTAPAAAGEAARGESIGPASSSTGSPSRSRSG